MLADEPYDDGMLLSPPPGHSLAKGDGDAAVYVCASAEGSRFNDRIYGSALVAVHARAGPSQQGMHRVQTKRTTEPNHLKLANAYIFHTHEGLKRTLMVEAPRPGEVSVKTRLQNEGS